MNAYFFSRRTGKNLLRDDAVVGIPPGHTVIGRFEPDSLVKIEEGKDDRRHRRNGEHDGTDPCPNCDKDRSNAGTEALLHLAALIGLHPELQNLGATAVPIFGIFLFV